ncbi:MAG: enoyl-CoA hydratase [Candidatus Fischerbacteria bacterium RBG_13_37_8]|uniref:Enoyl-CoA hydratase n=1 Tax=Candidatus Fischerbacteria bacterium RBG_13_37_8 TaxID=1817863 RepID=A0A1F5VWJ0_9BACT|nr:MAG: enoyl-CoA hydratase [Candidatus Fischerbacteria bacterium RBG_13_37_8]
MNYQNILYEKKGEIAYVTINRPQVLNALNGATVEELSSAFESAKNDTEVRALIITGSGEKAFVAGADISELATKDPQTAKETAFAGQGMLEILEDMGKPSIAAINGFALGGGCELALACTFRIAAENAKIGQPEVKLGLIPGYGGTQRLARRVGSSRALMLILTGDHITAEEAYRIGLVDKVVVKDQLMMEAETICKKILAQGPAAVVFALQAINHGVQMTLKEGLHLEAILFGLLYATEDRIEGLNAFLQKRPPVFKGK